MADYTYDSSQSAKKSAGGVQVGGFTRRPSDSFTRPANTTAYAASDLVANNTTAGSVVPLQFKVARTLSGTGFIRGAKIKKSNTSTTNARFSLLLFRTSPVSAAGDNAAFACPESNYLGRFDITVDEAFSDGAVGFAIPRTRPEIAFDLDETEVIYGLLRATAAYTPASGETFTVTLDVHQD